MSLRMTLSRCFFKFNDVITQVTSAHMNRRQSASTSYTEGTGRRRRHRHAPPRVGARSILLHIIGLEAAEHRLGVCLCTALAYKYDATRPLL